MKKMGALGTALLFSTGLVAGLAAGPASAADDQGKWFFTPMVWGAWPHDSRRVDSDVAYGVLLGRNFANNLSAEFGFDSGDFDGRGATNDLSIDAYSLSLLAHAYRESRIHPYLKGGFAYTDLNRGGRSNDDGFMFQAGLGLLANLTTNESGSRVLQLRGEVLNRWALSGPDEGGDPSDFMAGLGLQFNFGKPRPVVVAAAAPEPEPEPAPVAPPPPADTDGDGVTDDKDLCPDTKPGTRVGPQGCDCDLTATLTFKFDSAELTDADVEILGQVVETLKRLSWTSGVIEGHTDSVGPEAYNQQLSERRANTVRQFLLARGVGDDRMRAVGFGESKPVADNATAEGRAENRRVVLRRTDCDEQK